MQFMVLLVLRHTLPIIISGAGEYSLTLFTVRPAGKPFILPKKKNVRVRGMWKDDDVILAC